MAATSFAQVIRIPSGLPDSLAASAPKSDPFAELQPNVAKELFRDARTDTIVSLDSTHTRLCIDKPGSGKPDLRLEIPLSPPQVEDLLKAAANVGTKGIEKKYAVALPLFLGALPRLNLVSTIEITQGYAAFSQAGDELHVREKKVDGISTFALIIKGSGTVVNGDFEMPISSGHYQSVNDNFVEGRKIVKTQYAVQWAVTPENTVTLVVDFFHRAGPQGHLGDRVGRGAVVFASPDFAPAFERSKPPFFIKNVPNEKFEPDRRLAEKGFFAY